MKRKKIMTAVILFIVLLFCIIWGKNKLAGTRIYVNTDTAKVEEIRKYINLVGTIGSENLKRYYVINGIVNVVALGSSFICGVFVPMRWLPDSVLKMAHLLPTYYYVSTNEALKTIEQFNIQTLKPLIINMAIILCFALLFIILTNIISRKKRTF